MNTNKLEIMSERSRRGTVRQGGWTTKDWEGTVPVVVILGVPRYNTIRRGLSSSGSAAKYDCTWSAVSRVEREGKQFRARLKPKARI